MIYLDNAATTKMAPEVLDAMLPYFSEAYGNPSSIYSLGAKGKAAINRARGEVAQAMGAQMDEIYFTGCGTEADNWAIIGAVQAHKAKGRHIITSKIEHHAVLNTCQYLEKNGFQVTYLDVDKDGLIDPRALEEAIRPDTILISLMFANNEIGTVEPIETLGNIAKNKGILFHTDAVQAFGHLPIDVAQLPVDLLSVSAHKLHGPKGVGGLYIRKGTKIEPFLHGGAQERGRRAGTENVAGIVGFGTAVDLMKKSFMQNQEKEQMLRDYLIEKIKKEIPYVSLNGHPVKRLPNNVNVSFRFVEGESVLIMLDRKGICASSGSACTSGSLDPSHVLLAIGRKHEDAHGSIRLTVSEENTLAQMDETAEALRAAVERLRSMSPLYEDFVKGGSNV
jgi:cysteine desulfurase